MNEELGPPAPVTDEIASEAATSSGAAAPKGYRVTVVERADRGPTPTAVYECSGWEVAGGMLVLYDADRKVYGQDRIPTVLMIPIDLIRLVIVDELAR